MASGSKASRPDDRGDLGERDLARLAEGPRRMEAVIREIESQQYALKAGHRAFKWGTGLTAAFAIAVVAGLVTLDLSRIFVLGDRIAAVDKQTGENAVTMGYLREGQAEIKTNLEAVRADLSRVAVAVGAGRPTPQEEQKTELTPR